MGPMCFGGIANHDEKCFAANRNSYTLHARLICKALLLDLIMKYVCILFDCLIEAGLKGHTNKMRYKQINLKTSNLQKKNLGG